MKYRSTHASSPVEFSFGREQFSVPVGGTVEIADKWHPWVLSRGLYLEIVTEESAPVPAPEPVVEPAPEAPKPAKRK